MVEVAFAIPGDLASATGGYAYARRLLELLPGQGISVRHVTLPASFPDASDYLMVPAGSYDLEVRPTGATDVVLDLPGVELTGGNAYSVYAIGTVADNTLSVLPIVAGASMAEAAQEATPAA